MPPLISLRQHAEGVSRRRLESGLISEAMHGLGAVLLFTVLSTHPAQVKMREAVRLIAPDVAPYRSQPSARPKTTAGGGGGGDRSPTPASRGRAPRFSPRQFTPPAAVVYNPNPKLLMDPALIGPPDVPLASTT